MKRTSYPHPVSRGLKVAAVVSIATVALVLVTLQQGRTLRANRSLRDLPVTARAVLKIDPGTLQRSGAARTLFQTFIAEDQLSEIESTCGLNPLTALSEITVWVRGPEDQPFQSTGLMLRGRTVDAEALADCHRLLVEKRGGSVVRIDGPAGPLLASRDRRSAIAWLDDRSIVTGSVSAVAEVMAVRHGSLPSLFERPRSAELWKRLSPRSGIAAVLDPPANWKSALERIAKLGDGSSAVEGVEAIGLSVGPGAGQTVDLYIVVADAALAAQDAALIASWATAPPDSLEPPWSELLQTTQIDLCGPTIRLTIDVASLSRDP